VFYDLSHAIENDMTVYPGDPEPRIGRAEQDPPWTVSTLYLGTHTGTHMDAARHYYPDATTIDAYPVARFIVPATVVDVRGLGDDEPITWAMITAAAERVPAGGGVLLATGWDRHFRDERCLTHPYLTAEAARGLAAAGVGVVGTDAMNPDSSVQGTTDAHQILLGHGALLVENLTGLEQLEPGRLYRCAFVPLRLAGLDGSPIRAIAWDE
jgi:kynurenine formamidase